MNKKTHTFRRYVQSLLVISIVAYPYKVRKEDSMKVLGNGARTGLIIREKNTFEYKYMRFTAYKEKYIDHVTLTIVSDDTSEVVFKKNIYEDSCFNSLDDEVFDVMDEYTEEHSTEVDKLFSRLSKWIF